MANIMTLWTDNGAVIKSSSQWQLKRILKINNSWTELFNFRGGGGGGGGRGKERI